MTKLKKASVEKQDNSIMENNLNWLINGIDLENRRIEIRGDVDYVMSSLVCRAVLKMSEMSTAPIEIYLSSHGGDAYEGFAIYDALVACPCDIHMIASGKIMSAGFVIFLAGDKRVAAAHTSFMAHSTHYAIEGTVKEHEIHVQEGKRINNIMMEIAAKRTKRDKKWWIRNALTLDRFLSVEEATQLGIINSGSLSPKLVKKKVTKKVRGKK